MLENPWSTMLLLTPEGSSPVMDIASPSTIIYVYPRSGMSLLVVLMTSTLSVRVFLRISHVCLDSLHVCLVVFHAGMSSCLRTGGSCSFGGWSIRLGGIYFCMCPKAPEMGSLARPVGALSRHGMDKKLMKHCGSRHIPCVSSEVCHSKGVIVENVTGESVIVGLGTWTLLVPMSPFATRAQSLLL